MPTFRKGDVVWIYWSDKQTGYPQMYHRPGIITKKVHPRCFMVAFADRFKGTDGHKDIPYEQWTFDRRSHDHHPTDLHPHNLDPGAELKRRREQWKQETPADVQAAWWKAEAERKKASEAINRRLRPIMARILSR